MVCVETLADWWNEIGCISSVFSSKVTLNGITKRLMDRLQSVLNAAARLVHNSRKYAEADLGMCGRTGAPTKRGPPHEDKHKFFYCC